MSILSVHLFLMAPTAATIRLTACITKTACSNPPRKSSWNISARGTTERVMPVLRHSLSNARSRRCASGSGNGLREAHLMFSSVSV